MLQIQIAIEVQLPISIANIRAIILDREQAIAQPPQNQSHVLGA